ncbi:MAG TPA: sigma-70 family RNA polymerase sigma factor [Nocardioides sp.]|uniref:sigma-70 family RNA polymerase sigma factor n=1 Tax=Nocardioides sp. TaxID=35761 RepID=UPI002E3390F9|nr:sigma-70 family RNA polymerase sigma factor [Nocardioides sp.]HEX5086822.1 sigma-70 family RNA polymerase sigma factor [Nocardioides sp.]
MSESRVGWGPEQPRALYDEHAAALTAYVQRMLHGDRHLAEDIVQETMLRAWRRAGTVPDRARRRWLFTTARHLVIDSYRARNARPKEVPPEQAEPAADDDLDRTLDTILLTDALRTLSHEHRSVLHDAYFRGMTAAQIAAARGLPPGTVRSRLYYGLRALRLALQERGVTGL